MKKSASDFFKNKFEDYILAIKSQDVFIPDLSLTKRMDNTKRKTYGSLGIRDLKKILKE